VKSVIIFLNGNKSNVKNNDCLYTDLLLQGYQFMVYAFVDAISPHYFILLYFLFFF